jgi:excinuclease ABC subunit C
MRGARRKDTRYFGPYAHAYAIRETLDLLLRSFPIRTCSDAKLRRHQLLGRPCLLYHIERCSGPCVGAIKSEEYGRLVAELMEFLDGDTKPVVDRLEAEMRHAAGELEFERAARLRDRLATVRLAVERQQMVTDTPEDLDALAIAEDELAAAVQVFHVRRGRVVGRHGFIVEKVEPLTSPQLIGRVLEQHYAETPIGIPRDLLLPELPEEAATYEEWLSGLRNGKVSFIVPRRGRKRQLLATAGQNAEEQLKRHRLRRASDLTSRAAALEELQQALGLDQAPLRIECYDMSHIQGTDYVGSMVVLEDGLPKRSDYRRFKVTAVQGNDDYGAMREVLTRRLRRLSDAPSVGAAETDGEDEGPEAVVGGRRRSGPRFAYPPQLLLLDGGKGQLGVGVRVLEELGLTGKIAVASLAKQLEEVFVPGRQGPVQIPRDSEAIYLLQQARDEAHRFAIGFHRELRGRRMTRGALEGIAGLGPARRRRLISELGGVRAVQAASLDDLLGLRWLPPAVARAVHEHLHARRGSKAG